MSLKYSEDELAMLTDDEREALTAPDEDDDGPQAVIPENNNEGEGSNETGDGKNEGAKGQDGADPAGTPAADGADATAAPAPEPVIAGPEAKGDEPSAKALPPQPVFVAPAVDDVDAKLAAIEQRLADARKQYNDGVIDFEALDSLKDKLSDEKLELRLSVREAHMAAEMQRQQAQNEWIRTATTFAAAHGYNSNQILFETFDRVVVSVATSPEGEKMDYGQVLEAAHQRMVDAGLGKAAPAAAAPAAGKPAAPAKKPNAPQPPNLALVPAADTSSAGGNNRFAALDKLASTNPAQYEAEFANLSEREQEAYLRA